MKSSKWDWIYIVIPLSILIILVLGLLPYVIEVLSR
jgi:hypothetical protein